MIILRIIYLIAQDYIYISKIEKYKVLHEVTSVKVWRHWKTSYHILVSVLHCFIKSFYMQFIAHLDENDKSKLVMFLKLIWLIIIVIVFLVKPLDFFARIFLIASDVKISWIQNVLSFEVWKDVYMHNKLCLMHCYR